jgi:uncharacterized protein (DUF305 family)
MTEPVADPRFPPSPGAPDPTTGAEEPVSAVDDDGYRRRWFHPPSALQAVAMVVVLLLLGGIVGWLLTDREEVPAPTSTDVGFLQDMITHHEQAVTMSELALAGVTDESTRRFAEEVLFFQARELGIMQHLLDGWGYDLSERPETAMEWMGMPVPYDQMAGMATDEQMDALRAAVEAGPSPAVDEQFLDLMIRHHLGGAHMADWGAEQADDADVRELAGIMAEQQRLEVTEYQALQERLGFPVTQ